MQLTDKQIQLIIGCAVLFVFNVGLLYILRSIFRSIRKLIRKATYKIQKFLISRSIIRQKGFKNNKGDIWYPNGQIWNMEKKSLEKGDYNIHK